MDERTEYWHTHDTNCSLREYLGMSVEEYALWLKRGDSVITDILQRRRERNFGTRPHNESLHGFTRKEA